MSEETYQALDAALKAHIADECNPAALVTGWATTVAYITEDPKSDHYAVIKPEQQMNYGTIGLLHVGLEQVDAVGWGDDE